MLKVLDLFSGIGGFSLGLERAGFQTIAFCEIEKYPRQVLKKHWPDVPIHKDIRKLDGKKYRGAIDVICGGFPCQPFSVAGKQKGKEDNRHLWPEMLRIIREAKPAWVIGENVAGFIRLALDDVLLDLENEGYTTQPFVIPACAVGGVHRRDRVWIIAYAKQYGSSSAAVGESAHPSSNNGEKGTNETGKFKGGREPKSSGNLQGTEHWPTPDTNSPGWWEGNQKMERAPSEQPDGYSVQPKQVDTNTRNNRLQRRTQKPLSGFAHIQGELVRGGEAIGILPDPSEPAISGICNGFPSRVDRVKALGNAVVPQIPELIGRAIINCINKT